MDMDWREILKKLGKFICHAMNKREFNFDQINAETIQPELTKNGFRIHFHSGSFACEGDDACYYGIYIFRSFYFYDVRDSFGHHSCQITYNFEEARAIYDSVVDWLLEH